MCIGYMQAAFQSYIFMQPQWQSVICRWYGWIYHHFIFVLFLYFSNHSSCHTDQFTVSSLKFGTQDITDPGLLKIRNPHWFVVVGFFRPSQVWVNIPKRKFRTELMHFSQSCEENVWMGSFSKNWNKYVGFFCKKNFFLACGCG